MSTSTKDSKPDTNIPHSTPTKLVTRSGKADFDLRHILTTIGLNNSEIENVIFT